METNSKFTNRSYIKYFKTFIKCPLGSTVYNLYKMPPSASNCKVSSDIFNFN